VSPWLSTLFDALLGAAQPLVYLLLALFAAGENLVPPLPADVVVLVGAFLTRRGEGSAWVTFLVVWCANVGGALLVYAAGRRWGPAFFSGRMGSFILQPGQLARLELLYRRRGFVVIFLSRLLPMFRSVVPVFAGVSGIGFWRTFAPVAAASALWYGCIVVIGSVAADNLERLLLVFAVFGRFLGVVGGPPAAVLAWLWWATRTRRT
jgi:membrane protein DedA with SNARE-associated domain